jgi:ubiquinone/menaquinone biosynthesis C-methylase UbiE
MSSLGFRVMALELMVRDFFRPRKNIVKEAGIQEGFHVLDYGCGPGGYILSVAQLVGKSGKIYALDINPLAVAMVKKMAAKNRLMNVETILANCKTGLPNDSVNVVLLYDVFHDLADPNGILRELHRVLRQDGILSFNDHHMRDDEITSKLTDNGLFKLLRKGERTYSFVKNQGASIVDVSA